MCIFDVRMLNKKLKFSFSYLVIGKSNVFKVHTVMITYQGMSGKLIPQSLIGVAKWNLTQKGQTQPTRVILS